MAEKLKPSYQLNKRIKDDTFNEDLIAQYNLSLQINNSIFRICITDSEKNRCLFLEDYNLKNIFYPEQLISVLAEIYDSHSLLQAGYWRTIRLAIKDKNFSLIPYSLFDKKFAKEYLAINCTIPQEEDIYYYRQNSTDAVNIFSADKTIIDWFVAKYPLKSVKVVHHTSPFIEGLMMTGKAEDSKTMFITVEDKYLTIAVKEAKQLEYCNTFYFSTTEDFVYFTMFVFDQLRLNPETTKVVLFGEISQDSAIFNKLSKYVRSVSFGNKPSNIYFGYNFDEVFDHRFFDLFSMHLCE